MAEQGKSPKKKCNHLNITRVSHEMTEGDFWSDNGRVRGTAPVDVLAAVFNGLKSGKVTRDSLLTFLQGGDIGLNLVAGAEPMTLETLLFEHFLPKEKKRTVAPRTYDTALDEGKRLTKTIGQVLIHEIRPSHAKHHKETRQSLGKANVSTRQDLNLLSQAMNYAVESDWIKNNPLRPVKGLPNNDRSSIWPRLNDIPKLLISQRRNIKPLAYFILLTSARLDEALAVTAHNINWEKREIRIPNSKRRRKNPRSMKKFRTLKLDDLGPRLEWLLKKIINPDPISGHLFPGRFPGTALHPTTAEQYFLEGIKKAGLDHLVPAEVIEGGGHPHLTIHDLRGGFANHGSVAGWTFQKLRGYMGQIDAQSIQNYLDEADGSEPSESIFVHPPLRVRRAQKRAAIAQAAGNNALRATTPIVSALLN